MRKFTAMVLALALMLTLFAGLTISTATAEGEKVKIKYYGMAQDDDPDSSKAINQDEMDWLTAKFPNVEFEFTRMAPGSDYRQQYDTLLMAGDGPTVAKMFPYVDIQTRLANGTVADITEYVTNWDLRKEGKVVTIFDEALSTPDGKWYAVPWSPYINAIVTNEEVIREMGGDPSVVPATWSEFAELAQKYTDKDYPVFGYLLLGSEWNAWTYTPWVWAAGGEMVRSNGDGTWALGFNEDAGVEAAMFLNSLIWKYGVTQKDVLESYDDMQNHFKAGQATYGWGTASSFSQSDLARFDQKQENMGVIPLPGKDEGGKQVAFAGGEVWTMSPLATPEQRDAAWEIINAIGFDEEYLTHRWTLENEWGAINANIPARSDLAEKKFSIATAWPDHWASQLAAIGPVAKPEPYCPHWNDLKNEIVIPLQSIYLKDGITFEEAKALLDECAETLYTKYPEAFRKP